MRVVTTLLLAATLLAATLAACGSAGEDTTAESATQAPTSSTAASIATSFDCGSAGTEVEKLVCSDAELAGLDLRLAEVYGEVREEPDADTARLTAEERGWIAGRNDCWKAGDLRQCVLEAYQTRLVELQASHRDAPVPPTVEYRCDDTSRPVSAVFYNDIDPPSMILTWGDDQAILIQQPSGSGIRYARDGATYAEHQGVIDIDFYGSRLTCAAG